MATVMKKQKKLSAGSVKILNSCNGGSERERVGVEVKIPLTCCLIEPIIFYDMKKPGRGLIGRPSGHLF